MQFSLDAVMSNHEGMELSSMNKLVLHNPVSMNAILEGIRITLDLINRERIKPHYGSCEVIVRIDHSGKSWTGVVNIQGNESEELLYFLVGTEVRVQWDRYHQDTGVITAFTIDKQVDSESHVTCPDNELISAVQKGHYSLREANLRAKWYIFKPLTE